MGATIVRNSGETLVVAIPPFRAEHEQGPEKLKLTLSFNLLTINKYGLPSWPPHFIYTESEMESFMMQACRVTVYH